MTQTNTGSPCNGDFTVPRSNLRHDSSSFCICACCRRQHPVLFLPCHL